MALVAGVASPLLRHANSESRLHARQRSGSAVLGAPGLNSCSPAAHYGSPHVDRIVLVELSNKKAVAATAAKRVLAALSAKPGSAGKAGDAFAFADFRYDAKDDLSSLHDRSMSGHSAAPRSLAAGTGNENRTTLPPLAEVSRGSVRLGSPSIALRPAKRSRSTSSMCDAQKQGVHQKPLEGSSPLKARSHSQSSISLGFLPALSTSQSSGALARSQQHDAARSDNDLENVLETALNGKSGVHKAPLEQRSSMESEAHFENLMSLLDGKESCLPAKRGRRASISDSHGDNENKLLRKGTGFVHLSSSSKKDRRRASISDNCGDNENSLFRKGTGFVHLSSSLEKDRRRASISDSRGDNENSLFRNGTGFVHLSSSSEEDGTRHTKIVDDHGDNESKLFRKGTGFVHLSTSSDEKERHVQIDDQHGDNENGILRKGTGFIHLKSVPKETSSVSFPDAVGDNKNHIQRQGTGFVFLKHVGPRVRIVDDHGDNENRLQRKGTGFIDLKCDRELLPSSPGSCSTRTVDSRCPCPDVSDTDVASEEYDSADACEEQMSEAELQ